MVSNANTVIVIGLIAAFLLAAGAATAGCTSQSPPESGTTTATTATIPQTTPVPKSSAIQVTANPLTRLYQVDGGCTYQTRVDVTNTGSIEYTNIAIRLDLVEGVLGSVRDTKNIQIERIVSGDHKGFDLLFVGECEKEYQVRSQVS